MPRGAAGGTAYRPGDWFYFRLRDGRYVPGRVVSRGRGHATLSFFFPPAEERPALAHVRILAPGTAVMAAEVSGLSLADGGWPVLGGSDDFDVQDWPVPEFETVVTHPTEGRVVQVERFDREMRLIGHEYRPLAEAGQRQPGGAMGAGYVEAWLGRRFDEGGLKPLHDQPWWSAATAGVQGRTPVQAGTVAAPGAFEQLVRLVLPGRLEPDAVDNVECLLLLELDSDVSEVDGHLLGPDGAEILVYTVDAHALARELRQVLTAEPLPDGSHLVLRTGPPGSPEGKVQL